MGLYSVKYDTYDSQKAMGYIAYMMAGSYFARTEPKPVFETWRLNYAEMNDRQKEEKEAFADAQMLRLGEDFLESIASLRCEVHPSMQEGDLVLQFETGGFDGIVCRITDKGRLTIEAVPERDLLRQTA